jgi:hypothetical protein
MVVPAIMVVRILDAYCPCNFLFGVENFLCENTVRRDPSKLASSSHKVGSIGFEDHPIQ